MESGLRPDEFDGLLDLLEGARYISEFLPGDGEFLECLGPLPGILRGEASPEVEDELEILLSLLE